MEIAVRAAVIFVFLWIITTAVGRSSLGELSTFQLLLYVTMGDLVQQAITQQDYSVTAGILAVSTFALLTVAFGWVNWRFAKTRPLIHGLPLVIVKAGEPVLDAMARTHDPDGPLFDGAPGGASAPSAISTSPCLRPTARCPSSPSTTRARAQRSHNRKAASTSAAAGSPRACSG